MIIIIYTNKCTIIIVYYILLYIIYYYSAFVGVDNYNHVRKCTEQHTLKYRIIILPAVLCGCEISSLTLREKCSLRVFENKVLRRIFVPQRDEVTGEWRRLYNEKLYVLYSPNTIRVINSRRQTWIGHVARMGKKRGA
jgi:hypothetical protein